MNKNILKRKERVIMHLVARSVILLCILLTPFSSNAQEGSVTDFGSLGEKQALLDLYNSTSGSAWQVPWNQDVIPLLSDGTTLLSSIPASDLYGVTIQNGDVISINLSSNKVNGQIPSSVANLTELVTLSIPSHIGAYPNVISGTLNNLAALTKLQTLDLSWNECTGLVDWLGDGGNSLISINLSSYSSGSNKLTINPDAGFANLSNLTFLSFDNNEFSGGSLTNYFEYLDQLTTLNLNGCGLTSSSFDPTFGGMAMLTSLSLSSNPIVNIPSAIGNLTTLTYLNLSAVSLNTLPSNFNQLDNLRTLVLSHNGISDSQLFSLLELIKGCAVLNYLSLSNNNLTNLSSNFNQLLALQTLDLSVNPIGASDLTSLLGSPISTLILDVCGLTNKLPSSLVSLSSLYSLSIGNSPVQYNDPLRNYLDLNSVGVEIVLKNIPNLKSLYMDWYAIAGPAPLPAWFGTNEMISIENLYLNNNTIQLPLPENFKLMDNLKILYLSSNQLNGALPSFFHCGELPNLRILVLSNNQLTNPLPDFSNCTYLEILDISYNLYSGAVPPELTSLSSFYRLVITNNDFSTLPDFSAKSNFQAYVANNYFDFEDLSSFFDTNCTQKVAVLTYYPQKDPGKLGSVTNFYVPEGFDINLIFEAPGGTNNYYKWQRFNGSSWIDVVGWPVHPENGNPYLLSDVSSSNAGLYRTKIKSWCMPLLEFTGNDVWVNIIPPLCESVIPPMSGAFKLDKLTGTIVFSRDDCSAEIPITCVFGPQQMHSKVVSASAVTHSDNWSYSYLNETVDPENPFNSGERGKWRPKASYTYSSKLDQANDKNYNAGTFRYKAFNWKYGDKSGNPGWLLVNRVEKYSPNGEAVEEYNTLNIPSAAKFGYHDAVPYLIAQNAEYKNVFFESFENVYDDSYLEDGFQLNVGTIDGTLAHAGKSSLQLSAGSVFSIHKFNVTQSMKLKGLQVKLWLHSNLIPTTWPKIDVYSGINLVTSVELGEVVATGNWTLLAVVIDDFSSFVAGEEFELKFNQSAGTTIWIDDLRIQPAAAEMTTYVYDKSNLRLLTVFDDQHFGLYYQYNGEGKLVRKAVETTKGVKTVQETQYNLPKVDKNQ